MKKFHKIKQKIIFCVMSVAVLLSVLITIIMSAGNISSTNTALLDNVQTTARIASQGISSNLHLLTERMYNLSQEPVFAGENTDAAAREACLANAKLQIEFVWLSAYDLSGKKLYGDAAAPDSISDQKYFSYMKETENLVIGEPYYADNTLQLTVSAPLKTNGEISGILTGSYKYDLLNDVLSMLIVGSTGSACITNEDGLIIGDRNLSNIKDQKTIYDLAPSEKAEKLFEKMLSYQTGSDMIRMNGKACYAGYAPIPGTNWALLIHAPMSEFLDTSYKSIALTILFTVILLVLSALAAASVSRKISVSLDSVTVRLQKLADGNLTDEVLLSQSRDETAILTDALAKTVASLNTYIQNIETCLGALSSGDYTHEIPDSFDGDFASIKHSLDNISFSLNRTMLRMSQTSQEARQNSMEVTRCAGQLKDGALQQTQLLEQLGESMALITASINRNKDNVLQIEACSENASEKTTLGGSYMHSMLGIMNEIHDSVEEISKISKLISDISFQTNLLSLNASIEAARAGEAGHGFAVVAAEIGQLARKTSESLQQTDDIISRSAGILQKGLEAANETAAAFQEIQNVTEQYREISAQLADTAEEQTQAVSHVTAQLNCVQEIAQSNQQLSEATDEIAASSLAQSDILYQHVSKVKLKQEKGGSVS